MFRGTVRLAFVACASLVALALAAPCAAAQITFAGVPWGAPADSVRARLDAAGWRHVRTFPDGTLRFRRADDAVASAVFHRGALASVEMYPPPTADAAAAFRAAVDSLRAARGAPFDTTGGRFYWRDGVTGLAVARSSGVEPPVVAILFYGPAMLARRAEEVAAGQAFPALDSAWVPVAMREGERLSIDTARVERRGPGVWRVRLRIDTAEPRDDPPGGMADTVVRGIDFDCANRRTQLRSRTTFLRGRQVRHDAGATVWAPVRQGTAMASHFAVVCQFVARPTAAP